MEPKIQIKIDNRFVNRIQYARFSNHYEIAMVVSY